MEQILGLYTPRGRAKSGHAKQEKVQLSLGESEEEAQMLEFFFVSF